MFINRDQLNKLQNSHRVEEYVAVQRIIHVYTEVERPPRYNVREKKITNFH